MFILKVYYTSPLLSMLINEDKIMLNMLKKRGVRFHIYHIFRCVFKQRLNIDLLKPVK